MAVCHSIIMMSSFRRIGTAILLLIACSSLTRAFPSTKILFHGNTQIASGQLLGAIGESILKRNISNRSELLLLVEQVKQSVQRAYSDAGYLYALIDSFQTGLAVPDDSTQGFQLDF